MSRKLTSNKNRKGIRSMTQSAIEQAALADPDAQPLTAADLKRMRRTPQIKVIRRALGLGTGAGHSRPTYASLSDGYRSQPRRSTASLGGLILPPTHRGTGVAL
jgi:hypothetical protein